MPKETNRWTKYGIIGFIVSLAIIFINIIIMRLSNPFASYPLEIAIIQVIVGFVIGAIIGTLLRKSKMKEWKKGGITGVLGAFFYSAVLAIISSIGFNLDAMTFLTTVIIILGGTLMFIIPGFLIGALAAYLLRNKSLF